MKSIIGVVVLVVVGVGVYMLWNPAEPVREEEGETIVDLQNAQQEMEAGEREVVSPGSYEVVADQSSVGWAGKKPLVEGYVNAGSIAVTDGTIVVAEDSATGTFTVDMNTLSVSETPTKPGQENALEGHLKGERWFDVATYPTATFAIDRVTPRADSETTFVYDVTGELTMKGQTHEVTFPATIYKDAEGMLHAHADFEIDRTKWGITAGSGSFFDGLADNVIDDMVALSFDVVAVAE